MHGAAADLEGAREGVLQGGREGEEARPVRVRHHHGHAVVVPARQQGAAVEDGEQADHRRLGEGVAEPVPEPLGGLLQSFELQEQGGGGPHREARGQDLGDAAPIRQAGDGIVVGEVHETAVTPAALRGVADHRADPAPVHACPEGKRDVDRHLAAVLAQAQDRHGLAGERGAALRERAEHAGAVAAAEARRDDDLDRLPREFARFVAEQALARRIHESDAPVRVHGEEREFGRCRHARGLRAAPRLTAEVELRHHQPGEIGEAAPRRGVEVRTRGTVEHADRADPLPARCDQGRARVEAQAQLALHHGEVAEARVAGGVRHHHHALPPDRVGAEGFRPRRHREGETVTRLEPLRVLAEDRHSGHRGIEQGGGQGRDAVEVGIRRGIGEPVGCQLPQALLLVRRGSARAGIRNHHVSHPFTRPAGERPHGRVWRKTLT